MKRVTSIIMVLAMLVSLIPVNVSADGLQEEPSQEVVQQEQSEQQSEEELETDSQEQTPEEEPKEGSQEPLPEEDFKEEPQIPEEELEEDSQIPEKEPEVPAILTWEEYCYTLLTDESVSICGFEGAPENEEEPFLVEIPSKINGSKVTEIAEKAFAGNAEIEGVLLPETIETIGSGAFENCGNLKVIAFCGDTPSFEESLVKGSDKLEEIDILEKWDFYALTELLEKDLGENAAANITFQSFETVVSLVEAFCAQNQPEPEESEGIEDDTGTQTGQGYVTYTTGEGDGTEDDTIVANGTCGENLTWNLDNTGMLTISGTGDMEAYDYGTAPWYDIRSQIGAVTIKLGVTSIGAFAFYNCTNITSVAMPDSVVNIADRAFSNCSALNSIVIPSSVASIGDMAFDDCSSLVSLTIPDSVTSIGIYAFSGCTNLSTVVVGEGLSCFSESMFYGCSKLINISIPRSVTSIENSAFQDCSSLSSIEIPGSVTDVGDSSFYRCSSLTEVSFSEGVLSIGERAFQECTALEKVSMCNSITSIGIDIFRNCSKLSAVNLSEGLSYIPRAFEGCVTLSTIKIPDNVTSIANDAFSGCTNLRSITLGYGIKWIGKSAFSGCSNLLGILVNEDNPNYANDDMGILYNTDMTSVVRVPTGIQSVKLVDKVKQIEQYAFAYCASLENLIIPDTVQEIGNEAYYSCTNLLTAGPLGSGCNIEFAWTNAIPENAFNYAYELTDITLPDTITKIGSRAFFHCWELKNIHLPEGLTQIGSSAFSECATLKYINLPSTVVSMGSSIFEGCQMLTTAGPVGSGCCIEFAWNTIPSYAFYNSDYLAGIILPEGLSGIGAHAFTDCAYSNDSSNWDGTVLYIGSWLIDAEGDTKGDYTIKEGTIGIADDAFRGCFFITGIDIPHTVKYIGNNSFYSCSGLKEVILPESLIRVGEYAFYDCVNLTSVLIPDGTQYIDNGAFCACDLSQIIIPVSVKYIGSSAFYLNDLESIYYAGSEEQWAEITIGTNNYSLQNATIHYNSTDPDNEYADAKLVLYFRAWNPEEKLVYWGNLLGLLLDNESQVTEETDTSFLDHLDQLVGKYVLVELKYRTDNLIGPNTLIRIQPVETRFGTVSALDGNTMTIDGKDYTVPEDLTLPTVYVNTRVLYHFDDNGLQGIERLSVKKGTLSGWDAQTQEMAIRPENGLSPSLYTLSPLADEETVTYLRSYFSGACRSVCYYFDDNKFVYRIVEDLPSYNVPPEYVKPDPAQDYLVSYQNEWETAYRNLMDAVKQALDEFAGNPEVEKQDAIAAEALRMKTHDDASFSKYISGTLGPYEDVAYQALAQYFYEEISQYSIPDLSSIDLSGSMAGTQIVNNVLKNIGGESKEYTIDGIHIQIVPAILGMGTGFGKMVIDENTTVIFCSTQDQCREIIGEYLKELQDLATNSTYNVVSAVYQDILGKPISSLTNEYVTQVANKIERKLAVTLAEKFKLAGVGDLFQTLDTCYTYYTWAKKAVNTANTDDIQAAVNNIMNLNFEDTSIKNAAVKSAMKKLNSASSKLTRAFNEYLDGTIEEKENSFWRLLFGCPINISVFNSSGEQIGYISDDDIWYTSAVKINRLGSAKEIIVLDHDTPSFVISATDYGEMSCSFEEYDSNFLPIGRLNYYSIPLTPGQDFSVTLVDNLEAHAEELAIESNGELIYPDEYIPVTQNAAVSISCNFEGIDEGTVYGTGVYVCGEAVLLSAVPQDGYQFVGWYDDGDLVCESPSYEFTARTDKILTAKFRKKTESVQIDVIYDDGGFAMGGGTYSKNREVALLAIPYDAYSFTGWYQDGQFVSGSAEYSIHADADVILEARFAKHEHLYDTPTFSWAEDYSCTATFTCVDGDDVQTIDCTIISTTTPATETAAGKTVYTATVDLDGQTYMDTRVVTIPPTNHTAHVADTTWHSDGTSHWHECTVCSEKMDVTRHSGGTATCTRQAECEICGIAYGDLAPHDYESTWTQAGEVGHWHVCKNCSAHDSVVPHVPGAAATATTAQTCTKCGFVIASATSHTHTTDSTWHSNGTYHWHLCTSCGAWVSTSQHSYSSDTDTTCNVCGYTRTVNATEPTAGTEEAVVETENPHISENTTVTETLKPTTEASQGNDEVSISNDGVDNSDPNSFGVSGILIAALVIIMVGSLAGLAMLFIYKRRHD